MKLAMENTNMQLAIVRAVPLIAVVTAASALAAAQTQGAQRRVTVPVGTRVLIRMVDSVDSSKQQVGYRFTGYLETNFAG